MNVKVLFIAAIAIVFSVAPLVAQEGEIGLLPGASDTIDLQWAIEQGIITFESERKEPGDQRPSYRQCCCYTTVDILEPYYESRSPVFYYRWWGDDEDRGHPLYAVGWKLTDDEETETIDSLALIPEKYWPVSPKFEYAECMDGNWSWTLEMVDTLGVTRASISRDCNELLHVVVDDLQVNLPEGGQCVTKRPEPVGTME